MFRRVFFLVWQATGFNSSQRPVFDLKCVGDVSLLSDNVQATQDASGELAIEVSTCGMCFASFNRKALLQE